MGEYVQFFSFNPNVHHIFKISFKKMKVNIPT